MNLDSELPFWNYLTLWDRFPDRRKGVCSISHVISISRFPTKGLMSRKYTAMGLMIARKIDIDNAPQSQRRVNREVARTTCSEYWPQLKFPSRIDRSAEGCYVRVEEDVMV
jgi:hypothetical protein